MAKGKVLSTIIDISGEISPTLGKTLDTVTNKLDGVNVKAMAVGAGVAAIAGAAAVGFGKATKYLADLGDEYDRAADGMAASTGLVGEELAAMEGTMQDVYAAGFGEDMKDVADSMSEVRNITKLTGDELKLATESAYLLEDAFDMDKTESTRAAQVMMEKLGVSAEKAYNLIAVGAQNGANQNGDLGDTIAEFAPKFADAGLSAEQMMTALVAGNEEGVYQINKVGDAINEFTIRAKDMSKSSAGAFEAMGMDADTMFARFAAGGTEAQEATFEVINALQDMDDPLKQNEAAVALFGSFYEDMGGDLLTVLGAMEDAEWANADALSGMNEVKFDNLGAAMDGIKRQAEVALLPAAGEVQQAFMDIAPRIQDLLVKAEPVFTQIAGAIGPTITAAMDLAENGIAFVTENMDILLPVVAGLTGAFVAYKAISAGVAIYEGIKTAALATGTTVTSIATAATWALNAAMAVLTSPITIAVVAIGALIAAGVALYRNWDTVKEYAAQLGEFLSGVWTNITTGVGNLVGGIKDAFVTGFQSLVSIVKGPVNAVIGIVNGAINGINSIGFDIPDWVPIIGGKSFALNIPNLPMLASGGITNGPSIAGEAGTEYVISGDPAYRAENLSYWEKAGEMLGAFNQKNGETPALEAVVALDLPMLAAGGFTNGPSIAGEAGTEAVISFDPAYREDNLSYWAKAGRMLGADDSTYTLGGNSGGSYVDMGGVTFAPNITITGQADKGTIMEAIEAEYPEFIDFLEEWLTERGNLFMAEYITVAGDTFDGLALRHYDDEKLASVIIQANPDHCGVLIFEAGATLSIPEKVNVAMPETLPPWRRET